MLKVHHHLALRIGDDADEGRLAILRASDDASLAVSSTQFTDYLVGSIALPADGGVVPVPLGALADVRGVYLEVYGGGVLACINPATAPQALDAGASGTLLLRPAGTSPSGDPVPAHLYLDSGVARLYLASADAQPISGTFALWGFGQQGG